MPIYIFIYIYVIYIYIYIHYKLYIIYRPIVGLYQYICLFLTNLIFTFIMKVKIKFMCVYSYRRVWLPSVFTCMNIIIYIYGGRSLSLIQNQSIDGHIRTFNTISFIDNAWFYIIGQYINSRLVPDGDVSYQIRTCIQHYCDQYGPFHTLP